MMMPAHKPPLPDGSATAMSTSSPSELAEADFFGQVFYLAPDNAASVIDDLVTKATGLGISVSRSSIALSTIDKRFASSAESNVTVDTSHARTASTESKCSASTTLTSASSDNYTQESVSTALNRKRSRNLAFSQYDKLLAQINPNLDQPKFPNLSPPTERHSSTASLFSVSTRKSYLGIRNGILKIRRKRRPCPFPEALVNACREDFKPDQVLEKLPCGHSYCTKCLRIMINQSSKDETKMPPRCCTQPIPGLMIRSLLSREEQTSFLKAVQLYSTPWENRVFCSNPNCGEFIPPRARVDPKHPFQTTCRNCQNRVCIMCKRDAHPLGHDCPSDVELEAVLKIGEASGWRRCYKCRNLFCYVCGGVWTTVGCPNYCNGEEELERRRIEEAERLAAQEAEEALAKEEAEKEAAENVDAEERTKESIEFQTLRISQAEELERFRVYERKTKWLMWTRQSQEKLALVEKQSATIEKMKERHVKTTVNLEDRQVQAELELRGSLEQSERNVRIRLKHMEAYCDGLGQNPSSGMPRRVVTERDLRELGQQYNVEKNMRQLHQAKINVMRDRQAKALEELQQRQEAELGKLLEKDHAEIEALESSFADQEDTLAVTFNRRRQTMDKRWELSMRILQKELESKTGLRYSILAPLQWPQEKDSSEYGLSPVEE
ncbi:putative RING-type domain-containing protein [Seiridium cardinale]